MPTSRPGEGREHTELDGGVWSAAASRQTALPIDVFIVALLDVVLGCVDERDSMLAWARADPKCPLATICVCDLRVTVSP